MKIIDSDWKIGSRFSKTPIILRNFYRHNNKINCFILQKSEISLSIKQACGLGDALKNNIKDNSVTSMLQRRELGPSFSAGQKCKIVSNFLPNHMKPVAKYSNKAFCGSYSKDGRFFLTACQGKTGITCSETFVLNISVGFE